MRCYKDARPAKEAAERASNLLFRNFFFHPLVEIFLRQHVQISFHVVVAQTAKLSADNFVLSDFGGGKVQREIEAGNKILLNAQLTDEEGVANVLSVHEHVNFLVD